MAGQWVDIEEEEVHFPASKACLSIATECKAWLPHLRAVWPCSQGQRPHLGPCLFCPRMRLEAATNSTSLIYGPTHHLQTLISRRCWGGAWGSEFLTGSFLLLVRSLCFEWQGEIEVIQPQSKEAWGMMAPTRSCKGTKGTLALTMPWF